MSNTAKELSAIRSPRELIMQATLRLIADEGIDAVTHRRVAASAGVSPGTTTHHFEGRAALLRESFLYYMGFGTEFLEEIDTTALAGGVGVHHQFSNCRLDGRLLFGSWCCGRFLFLHFPD